MITLGTFGVIKLMKILNNNNGGGEIINSNIIEFSYEHGSYFGGYNDYHLYYTEEGIAHIEAIGYNGSELNIDKDIDESVFGEIEKIVNEQEIYKWDGFDESDNDILDGSSFSLKIMYKDGQSINAHGYMKYPDNYRIASDALTDYLNTLG
jgi:hypothetical protein